MPAHPFSDGPFGGLIQRLVDPKRHATLWPSRGDRGDGSNLATAPGDEARSASMSYETPVVFVVDDDVSVRIPLNC